MGYQESWFYIEPQHKFKKLIQAYEKAEQSGYYEVAGGGTPFRHCFEAALWGYSRRDEAALGVR